MIQSPALFHWTTHALTTPFHEKYPLAHEDEVLHLWSDVKNKQTNKQTKTNTGTYLFVHCNIHQWGHGHLWGYIQGIRVGRLASVSSLVCWDSLQENFKPMVKYTQVVCVNRKQVKYFVGASLTYPSWFIFKLIYYALWKSNTFVPTCRKVSVLFKSILNKSVEFLVTYIPYVWIQASVWWWPLEFYIWICYGKLSGPIWIPWQIGCCSLDLIWVSENGYKIQHYK